MNAIENNQQARIAAGMPDASASIAEQAMFAAKGVAGEHGVKIAVSAAALTSLSAGAISEAVPAAAASHPSVMVSGETVYGEGLQQGFSIPEWSQANPGVNPSMVFAGHTYETPDTPENSASGNATVTVSGSHPAVMLSGQTVSVLGEQQGFTVAQWSAANVGVDPNTVFAGHTYNDPNTSENSASGTVTANTPATVEIPIKPGDTYSQIAQEISSVTGTPVDEEVAKLEQENTEPATDLQPGTDMTAQIASQSQAAAVEAATASTPTPAAAPVAPVEAPASTSGTNDNMYVVGDSLAVGMEGGGLQADLAARGYTVSKFEATVGDSVADAIPKVIADSAELSAAGTVFVELGTNNCMLYGIPACESTPEFEGQVQNMIATIRKYNPTATIYWMNTYTDKTNANDSINQALANEAGPLNYKVLDWSNLVSSHPAGLSFDQAMGVHQETDSGYATMAQDVSGLLGHAPTPPPAPAPVPAPVSHPTNVNSAVGSIAAGSPEAQLITDLEADHFSAPGAAGVAGNVENESNFEPERLENTASGVVTSAMSLTPAQLNDPSLGWGAFQFTPAYKYVGPTVQAGLDPNSVANQVNFMVSQIAGSALQQELSSNSVSPATAALDFEEEYERPASLSDAPVREQSANTIYSQMTKG